jgi:GH15 family glucan-1,4-alpha-glucosidase
MASRIEDYAIVGDCESAALVARDGSIDWLCWPRFDSDACLAALLGEREHGRWRIAPADEHARVTRRYLDGTLILETRFETHDGAVRIVDFMPLRDGTSDLVRIVEGERGSVDMRFDLVLRFGYGRIVPWVTRIEDGGLRAIAGPDMVVLRAPVAVRGEGLTTVGEFTVRAGDVLPFVLSYTRSHLEPPAPVDAATALARTQTYWTRWSRRMKTRGRYADDVLRSLITLKGLTYAPTGGVVAAATTSLPETPGGVRNWDYRYCWLRDATLTLLALMNAGFLDEARAWRDWLLRSVAGAPEQMQIMYGIAGERRLDEWEVSWLPGHHGARPVRVGNAASVQLQLDVYGELMDVFHNARAAGLDHSDAGWSLQRALVAHLETVWQQADASIWEGRGPPRQFTYSKVMAWVALDRAVAGVERYGLKGPVERWRALRDRIHAEVCARAVYDGHFVCAYGASEVDASLLLIPELGFLPADDARVLATVAAVERDLVRDGFVLRYDSDRWDDGLPPGEGAFLACTFWLADAYWLCGRRREAQALFERLLAVRNDVGLLAEEYDPRTGRQLGNFPQAFSHVSLVNTALNISRPGKPAEQRAARGGGG